MNEIVLIGHISSEPKKREVQGRPVCLFTVDVTDRAGGKTSIYTHSVLFWDKVAEYALMNFGKGSAVLLRGKLTSRYAKQGLETVLRTEIVAYSITGLDSLRDKQPATANGSALQRTSGNSAPYPAAEPSEARIAAENGLEETEADFLGQESR